MNEDLQSEVVVSRDHGFLCVRAIERADGRPAHSADPRGGGDLDLGCDGDRQGSERLRGDGMGHLPLQRNYAEAREVLGLNGKL